jgi:hypothetical protein
MSQKNSVKFYSYITLLLFTFTNYAQNNNACTTIDSSLCYAGQSSGFKPLFPTVQFSPKRIQEHINKTAKYYNLCLFK